MTAQAQVCTPNPLYLALGIPGVYPNPQMQSAIASGSQGQPYTETFTLAVPADTTIDLSPYIGFPFPPVTVAVNFQEVTGFTGLPSGINYQCDQANCQWIGGADGCVRLSGTPTQGGLFDVGMETGYNITVPGAVPVIGGQALTIPFPGLNWDMDVTAVGVADPHANGFVLAQNAPNPFSGTTTIAFQAPKPSSVRFEVIDLNGRVLHATDHRASAGANSITFDASTFAAGIYLYRISSGDSYVIRKMMVE